MPERSRGAHIERIGYLDVGLYGQRHPVVGAQHNWDALPAVFGDCSGRRCGTNLAYCHLSDGPFAVSGRRIVQGGPAGPVGANRSLRVPPASDTRAASRRGDGRTVW